MKNTYFLLGPDDHGRSKKVEHFKNGQKVKTYNLDGSISLMSTIKKLKLSDNIMVIDKGFQIKVNKDVVKHLTLFNMIACADSSKKSLTIAQQICEQIPFKKIINHPKNVLKTTRQSISTLGHLKNIIMPQTATIKAQSQQELLNEILKQPIEFPLIIRIPHYHGGKYMKLLSAPSDLIDMDDWFSLSTSFNITEYFNVQDDKGYYHKARFAVVGGKVLPRHIIYSKQWCVHSENRKVEMINNQSLKNLELDFLSGKSSLLNDQTIRILEQIYDEIQLDFFGIDCGFLPNGKVVVFEANAAMNFFDQEYGDNDEFFYIRPSVEKIEHELTKLIA